jgi:putative transposase
MPNNRYERREPSHNWEDIRPLLKDSSQITYEIIRPVLLFGVSPKERAEETGMSKSSIYYKANLFDVSGMASLLPVAPPPDIPKQDKRALPPPIRQAIVDAHAQYPALSLHEIASICYVQFGRKPSPHTIQYILATGPQPSQTTRRYPRFAEIEDPAQRRRIIIKLHSEGWTPSSIAGYLETSRQTVHTTLKRWATEQFAGLPDKSRARTGLRKVDLKVVQQVKKLSENPLIGAYRVSAALEQMGIKLSRATCGRLLALNRNLYHLQVPPNKDRPKAEMPFRAERRHQFWSVDIRYIDMHRIQGEGNIYCISILENFSRAILASAITRHQDSEAYLSVLYHAIRKSGVPETIVSDSGGAFLSHNAIKIYDALGIHKEEIKKGKPYQNYIETAFGVQRRMADWSFESAHTWEDLLAAHEKWMLDYNHQKHMAHDKREDNCHSPAAVLGWVKGMQPKPELVYRAFSAIGETRILNKAGYAKFRNFLLYGELALAGHETLINIFQDTLALEYGEYPLAKYSVEWQPDDKHFLRVGNPRLYSHPYQSPQLPLWEPDEVEWHVIIRCEPKLRRSKPKVKSFIIQLALPTEDDGTG